MPKKKPSPFGVADDPKNKGLSIRDCLFKTKFNLPTTYLF